MTDIITTNERSRIMSLVKNKNTQPELLVRRLIHNAGFRYRLHDKKLPGTPDIVFSKKRKVIFVHGCFWHRHEQCSLARLPKSNQEFWLKKLENNRVRDKLNLQKLNETGWEALVLWECELRDIESLKRRLKEFLTP